MASVVALGGSSALEGFALVGVAVVRSTGPDEIRAAWGDLDDDVGLVILSGEAESALGDVLDARPDVLTVVLP
jgi:vacuolar-type H+-ATPase subunit F/Vma7